MPILLDLVYLLLLAALSPWLAWTAWRKGKYRQGYAEKFLGRVPVRAGERPCVWLHAVSVGEVNLLKPLVRAIERRHPEWQCVVSTTTRTGRELARQIYPQLTTFYCPLDFSWAVRAALRRVRPRVLLLAELELWPNLIRAGAGEGVRIGVINGRLSERSFRGYRRLRWLLRGTLARLDCIAAQNATYAERFLALGARPESVTITGSIKYDGAETCRDNPATARLRSLAGIAPHERVFLAGSTQEPEERIALNAWRELAAAWPNLRLILVPRHPERFADVAQMLAVERVPFARRSELADRQQGRGAAPRVLLVDAVGELGAWWGTADVAFVGGSLTQRGGQNMIEPAAYGAAVSFGPNTHNFRDIVAAMLSAEAAVVVRDQRELSAFVRRSLENTHYAAELGRRAQALVRSQLGATDRTMRLIEALVRHVVVVDQELPDIRDAA